MHDGPIEIYDNTDAFVGRNMACRENYFSVFNPQMGSNSAQEGNRARHHLPFSGKENQVYAVCVGTFLHIFTLERAIPALHGVPGFKYFATPAIKNDHFIGSNSGQKLWFEHIIPAIAIG